MPAVPDTSEIVERARAVIERLDVEVLIYTSGEIEAMAERPFLTRALREGKVIYERRQAA
ncbi:MAG: hypothetical protein HY897_22950 [Deltaproteobacteria bacterium]|nr:hypothetical protein [Deltaproteobacteria bacterium]